MIPRAIAVKALDNYVIFLAYEDGTQGVIDLKDHAHKGVFAQWDRDNLFSRVHIDNCGVIAWNEDLDMCPQSLYLKLKGITYEQWSNQS